jgi:hypothetical protein
MRARAVGSILLAVAALAACGDESNDENAGAAAGAAIGSGGGGECRVDATPTGTDEPEDDAGSSAPELSDVPDLPPPTIPENVSPPTTTGEEGPIDPDPVDPFDPNGDVIPALGGFRVDPVENGCVDFAVHLEQYGRFRIKSWGDDGIHTEVQVFSPSAEMIASWETGEPGTFEGYSWEDEGGLPEVGTYVIRTIYRGGSHNSFVLIMYGDV